MADDDDFGTGPPSKTLPTATRWPPPRLPRGAQPPSSGGPRCSRWWPASPRLLWVAAARHHRLLEPVADEFRHLVPRWGITTGGVDNDRLLQTLSSTLASTWGYALVAVIAYLGPSMLLHGQRMRLLIAAMGDDS